MTSGAVVGLVVGALADAGLEVRNVRCVVEFDEGVTKLFWLRVHVEEGSLGPGGAARNAFLASRGISDRTGVDDEDEA